MTISNVASNAFLTNVITSQTQFTPEEFIACLKIPNYKFPLNSIVTGNVNLDKSDITFLPEGLCIEGSLSVRFCIQLKSLPNGLRVRDTLYTQNSGLESLPDGLRVGSLSLCSLNITTLPKRLYVENDLSIVSTEIEAFPEDAYVGRNLTFTGTPLKSLPQKMFVKGTLIIRSCPNLIFSPNSYLHVGCDFILERCNMSSFLSDTYVEGSLTIGFCPNLIFSLEQKVRVEGSVTLDSCEFPFLPSDMHIKRDLTLIQCNKMISFPSRVLVERNLRIIHCDNLKSLGNFISVVQNLYISQCPNLRRIGNDLYVHGNATIETSGIVNINDGLEVNGIFEFNDCIVALPHKMRVEKIKSNMFFLILQPMTTDSQTDIKEI